MNKTLIIIWSVLRYLNFWAFKVDMKLAWRGGGGGEVQWEINVCQRSENVYSEVWGKLFMYGSSTITADIREYLCRCTFVRGTLRAEMSERQLWIVIFSPGIQNVRSRFGSLSQRAPLSISCNSYTARYKIQCIKNCVRTKELTYYVPRRSFQVNWTV